MKRLAIVTVLAFTCVMSRAAEIMKAANSDDMNLPSSWVGGVVPGPDDTIVMHPFTTTESFKLGDDLSVYGLILTNLPKTASLTFGASGEVGVLTLGGGGMLVRNSDKTVTIYTKTKLACDQKWWNQGGTWQLGSDIDLNGHRLTVEGSAEIKGNGNAHDGVIEILSGNYKMTSGNYTENADFLVRRNGGLRFEQSAAKEGRARTRNVTLDGSGHYDGALLCSIGRKEGNNEDIVSDTVTVTNGLGRIQLSPNDAKHQTLRIGEFANSAASLTWITGKRLGLSAPSELIAGHSSLLFDTAPVLVGGAGTAGTASVSILPWTICATNDSDYGSTFATYDATNGVRPLDVETEFATALVAGATGDDNVRLVNDGTGVQVTNLLAAGTTEINSLLLDTPANTKGDGGVMVLGGSDAVLKVKSGMVYARQMMAEVVAADAITLQDFTLDLNGHAGEIVSRQTKQSNMESNAPLQLDCVIANDGGEGVTFAAVANRGLIYLQGTNECTYTGPTRLLNGNLRLVKGKVAGNVVPAIPGDLYVYGGSCQNTGSQLKETASVYVYGGSYLQKAGASNSGSGASQTFKDLVIAGNGSVTSGASGSSAGSTTMNDGTMLGGTWTICRGHTINMQHLTLAGGTMNINKFESSNRKTQLKVANGIVISNTVAEAYCPLSFEKAENAQKVGSSLFLAGGLVFVGNDTNTNRVEIYNAPPTAEGATKAHFYMASTQTFDIGDGAADVDLFMNLDGADETDGAAAGLVKMGAGTLLLGGDNAYTGVTRVDSGRLIADGSIAGDVSVASGAIFRGGALSESGALSVGGDLAFAAGAKLEVEPGTVMTVEGAISAAGATAVLAPGTELTEDILVARASSISRAFDSEAGEYKVKIRNGGTELWLAKDRGLILVVR